MFFKISICKEEVMIKFMDQTLSLLDQILQWIVFGAFFIVGIIGTYNLFIVPVIGHVTMAFFIVVVILFMKLSAETTSMYSPGSNMNKTPQNKMRDVILGPTALASFFMLNFYWIYWIIMFSSSWGKIIFAVFVLAYNIFVISLIVAGFQEYR